MTRSRAIDNIPNDIMALYYAQRASAGLLITEGTATSKNALGYCRIPGCFTPAQVTGWKKVTSAVHSKGGKIFLQMMHVGRTAHPLNMPSDSIIVSPSAIAQSGKMYTDQQGPQDHPVPKEMSAKDIDSAIEEFATSSMMAIEAGFDGVEIHGANGYLVEQFLNPASNKRTDNYGGSSENRLRFALNVAKAVSDKIGGDRVGFRVSPYSPNGDMAVSYEGINEFYGTLASGLSKIGLTYIHVCDHSSMGAPIVTPEVKKQIRENFKGAYILSGGYNSTKANADLDAKLGDLVSFGRPFIANPNLVDLMKAGKENELKQPDFTKFYTPGPEGYTDY